MSAADKKHEMKKLVDDIVVQLKEAIYNDNTALAVFDKMPELQAKLEAYKRGLTEYKSSIDGIIDLVKDVKNLETRYETDLKILREGRAELEQRVSEINIPSIDILLKNAISVSEKLVSFNESVNIIKEKLSLSNLPDLNDIIQSIYDKVAIKEKVASSLSKPLSNKNIESLEQLANTDLTEEEAAVSAIKTNTTIIKNKNYQISKEGILSVLKDYGNGTNYKGLNTCLGALTDKLKQNVRILVTELEIEGLVSVYKSAISLKNQSTRSAIPVNGEYETIKRVVSMIELNGGTMGYKGMYSLSSEDRDTFNDITKRFTNIFTREVGRVILTSDYKKVLDEIEKNKGA